MRRSVPEGVRLYEQTESTALMRAIGAKGWDPMPPSQHRFYLDRDQPLTNRVVAVVEQATIRRRQQDGMRTAVALTEDNRFLEVADIAAMLDVTVSNCWVAVREAEKQGRIRLDAEDHIWFTGTAREPIIKLGERKAKRKEGEFVQKSIPEPILLFLKELPPDRRDKVMPRLLENAERYKQRKADAIALLREQEVKDAIALAAEEGYQHQEQKTGRPRVSETRPLTVKVTFVQIPEDGSVQKSVQTSVQTESDSVQIPHPYRSGEPLSGELKRVSEREPEANSAPEQEKVAPSARPDHSTPPTAPPQSKNLPKEGVDVLIERFEKLLGHHVDEQIKARLRELPDKLQLPWRSVVRILEWKFKEKRGNYKIFSAGALLQFAMEDAGRWVSENERELRADLKLEASERREGHAAEAEAEQFRREIDGFLKHGKAMKAGKG